MTFTQLTHGERAGALAGVDSTQLAGAIVDKTFSPFISPMPTAQKQHTIIGVAW